MRSVSTFKIPTAQAQYSPKLSPGGQLIAQVERWGFGDYILCCPLCSACHPIPANVRVGEAYTPTCNMATYHPTVYQKWIEAHPEAVGVSSVLLQYRQPVIIPLADDTSERAEAA